MQIINRPNLLAKILFYLIMFACGKENGLRFNIIYNSRVTFPLIWRPVR